MKKVTLIGAGFSGLTLAYHLNALGMPVEIFEKAERPGGLLGTDSTEFGLVEHAANAVLADPDIENLFANLAIDVAGRRPERKKRYIFWKRPTRWPLRMSTSLRLVRFLMRAKLRPKELEPLAGDTIEAWASRHVDSAFAERVVGPALQGVYASDGSSLSARLIINSTLSRNKRPGRLRGSVAPVEGMGKLVSALARYLTEQGVSIHYGSARSPSDFDGPVVVCTSAWSAAELLKASHAHLARALSACKALPLLSATAFFEPHPYDLRGFGCLFPKRQDFHALGVLFNASIFDGRSKLRSETWILGGHGKEGLVDASDAEITQMILSDRAKLQNRKSIAPNAVKIHRWPRAIPHYSVDWEEQLRVLKVDPPLFLHGNYLGDIGLGKIHQRSIVLAHQLKAEYGS